jgi:putative endonuclease
MSSLSRINRVSLAPEPVPGRGDRRTIGRHGEQLAASHLRRKGLTLLASNYRSRRGEIDLVVRDRRTLVFVEVKTRVMVAAHARMRASSDVWWPSRQRVRQRRAAAAWLAATRHPSPATRQIRFDVIAVLISPSGELVDLEHIEAAL